MHLQDRKIKKKFKKNKKLFALLSNGAIKEATCLMHLQDRKIKIKNFEKSLPSYSTELLKKQLASLQNVSKN